jgi:DNA-directed RNA polymerase subunit RPC12/RpoP
MQETTKKSDVYIIWKCKNCEQNEWELIQPANMTLWALYRCLTCKKILYLATPLLKVSPPALGIFENPLKEED